MKYKCNICHLFFSSDEHIVGGKCPECGSTVAQACENDHICNCPSDVHSGMWFCESCGKPICPCGSHDAELIERVTGYLADYAGMNSAKQREVRDRTRYNIVGTAISSTFYQ